MSEVAGEAEFETPVIVFALDEPLQPGDVISAYPMDGYEPQPTPVTIEDPSWFFLVDQAPGAEYVHPNKFVFVNAVTGSITSIVPPRLETTGTSTTTRSSTWTSARPSIGPKARRRP